MCRAFNFCNPLQVEAIMKYLFDHSKKSEVDAPTILPTAYQSDPANGIGRN